MSVKNYIIQAHAEPRQLYNLIEILDDKNVLFFVHIDLKVRIEPFKNLINKPNIIFIKERVDCIWGDFSQVQATINLIRNVMQKDNGGFTILLSGQDFPLRKNSEITTFLNENQDFNFIDIRPIGDIPQYKRRIYSYKFNKSSKRQDFNLINSFDVFNLKNLSSNLLLLLNNKISIHQFLFSFKRRKPIIKNQFFGSSWWAINYNTLVLIDNYITENYNRLYDYYKYMISCDEVFFQTIISELKRCNSFIKTKHSLTYANWERPASKLPVTFTVGDFEELEKKSEEYLFARKFDYLKSFEVINLIKEELLKKKNI